MFLLLRSKICTLRIHCRASLLNNQIKSMSSTQFNEHKIDVNGQTINYVKIGKGFPLLCFPGALGTIWTHLKPQVEGLDKNKFTIIAWDPPGYGASRPPDKNFNIKFFNEDADTAYDFMKQLGIQRYSILAWSDGGMSSMILAAKHPKSVEKLVVWGSNSYILPEEINSYKKIRYINKWSDKMKAPFIALYTEQGLQNMWNDWCDTQSEIYYNGGDICKSCLGNIKCPTLILHGDKDPILAPEHPNYLFANIKKAKLYRFPEGKHGIHLRYPKEFNKIVTDFLTDVS